MLALGAAIGAAFGFLTHDSWNYLLLAQSLKRGEGCSIAGSYFAMFPCGYPLAIALTAPSADMASLMMSSKGTNVILLFFAFLLLKRTFHNVLVPTFVIVNPFTIALFLYTWSENLFLLACCGSLFALSRAHRGGARYPYGAVALLTFFLLVGVSSRYFFAPFAAVVFLCAWLVYGSRTAIRTLPAFVVAALFFVAYLKFNMALTGMATGMPRIPAPETPAFLVFRFVRQLTKEVVVLGVSVSALLRMTRKYWSKRSEDRTGGETGVPESRLLALVGGGFLLLAFSLRLRTQYDLYDPRTLSYGLTFVVAGMAGLRTHIPTPRFPAGPVLIYGLLVALAAPADAVAYSGSALLPMLKDALANGYASPVAPLARYHSPATNADLIVTVRRPPRVAETVDDEARLYYPKHATVVEIRTGPYSKPDSVADIRKDIASRHAHACVIDFTSFATREDLKRHLDGSFPVAFSSGSGGWLPATVYQRSFDPGMRDYLLSIFQPGRFVPCPS
ncbi:hypothetical protein [Paraburkholderia piptadeniae]|uniref:hypothetical protein n=1 Tax=Paraburkholderia piptadeniae TaxID=1701573 RepID=UPI00117D6237|nr:hypothetical protein [Paraburkholderia piptadeniae]